MKPVPPNEIMMATSEALPAKTQRSLIEFERVTLAYGRGDTAVRRWQRARSRSARRLRRPRRPSGCGKSTILKLVSGLIKAAPATSSSRAARSARRTCASAWRSRNPTLLPWFTIRQNVMLPLKIVQPFRADWRRKKNGEYRERADALLAQVGPRGLRRQVSLAALGRACSSAPPSAGR
jgi:NitT/TauT family transport system ATP-binding protein